MKKYASVSRAVILFLMIGASVAALPVCVKAERRSGIIENCAPIAENLDYKTYKDISITGSLRAIDPDGDVVDFRLLEGARKGTVSLSGDTFTYTPCSNTKGSDTFTYVATDTKGNISQKATVSIDIMQQSSGVKYLDMDGNPSAYSALRLAEEGIFIGKQVGGNFFFCPDETVSRGEFLTMCLNAAGIENLEGITRTGFYDDTEMPLWVKPYVAAALMNGVVRGYKDAGGAVVFLPEKAVTYSEAAVMLSNALGISDVKYSSNVPKDSVAAWAYQASVNLEACDIISVETALLGDSAISRAAAADMLCAAMDIVKSREDEGFSLFSWVW